MQFNESVPASTTDGSHTDQDLGPLAWVLEELRKSLEGAVKSLRRFVRDADIGSGSDLAALDTSALRIARQQLHQACGALEMVNMMPPVLIVRAMEAAVQKFVQQPELCDDKACLKIEKATFALVEYLDAILAGKTVSAVGLFPQYRDVQVLAGSDRIHPADLWPVERRSRDPQITTTGIDPIVYGPEARARLDSVVLRIVKTGDVVAARELRDMCLGFMSAQTETGPRLFWKLCAGFMEAFSLGLLAQDVYVKRATSRILLQYATMSRGDSAVAERLIQDLLFFCSQAVPADPAQAPVLTAIRKTYSLDRLKPVNYEVSRFGRFDPAVLAQARKRIAAATETWSALAGGDKNKIKIASDQFTLVCESLRKLSPGSEALAQSLTDALAEVMRAGEAPSTSVAMEVATAVLYLQASFEDLNAAADEQMAVRAVALADRLKRVRMGGEPEPLDPWMEDLYRRVSDNQTMGSVVDELRATLGEAEKGLDQFFRDHSNTQPLVAVPNHLAQLRGVLSVLGMDQASLAVLRMRERVENLLQEDLSNPASRNALFEKLGNSLGALGFMIDMLSYQRALARKLFVYDEDLGELRLLMGRNRARIADPIEEVPELVAERMEPVQSALLPDPVSPIELDAFEAAIGAASAAAVGQNLPAIPSDTAAAQAAAETAPSAPATAVRPEPVVASVAAVPVASATELSSDEEELRDIFLEEAREVNEAGLAAVQAMGANPSVLAEQTGLRRAFHTLKGSSRMVGLNEFGDAAWAMEQLLNVWLADQKSASPDLLKVTGDSLRGFSRWVEDIAAHQDAAWSARPFREAADALRLEGKVVELVLPEAAGSVAVELPVAVDAHELAAATQESIASESADAYDATSAFELSDVDFHGADFQATEIPDEFELGGVPAMTPEELVSLDAYEIDFSQLDVAATPDEVALPEVANEFPTIEAVDIDNLVSEPVAYAVELPEIDGVDAGIFTPDMPLLVELPSLELPLDLPELESAPSVAMLDEIVPDEVVPSEFSSEQITAESVDADSAADAEFASDESVKVIETLRIGIPLYNVFLNEADEWSRRLLTELNEWRFEPDRGVPDNTEGLAHSLSGSSATVGFHALSDLARALEHALQHVQQQSHILPAQIQLFVDAGEDIRRVLHQFAAGFLKEAEPRILQELREVLDTEIGLSIAPIEENLLFMHEEAAEAAPDMLPPVAAALVSPLLLRPEALQRPEDGDVRALEAQADLDNEIDAVDVIDPDLFPILEEEAIELLPQLGTALRQWAARPENSGARSQVLHVLHTLKGSARMAGAMRLGEMAHRLESAIEHLGNDNLTSQHVEPLLANFDELRANFDALRTAGVAGQDPVSVVDAPSAGSVVPAALTMPVEEISSTSQPAAAKPRLPALIAPVMAPIKVANSHSVRVRAHLLDRLVNQAGEVMISRSRLEARVAQMRSSLKDMSGNLDRLRQHLRDVELQAESQMQSRLALAKDSAAGFDPLEFDRFTRVQELTRMMAESVNDVGTVQRSLQRTLEGAEDDLIAQGRQARELQRDLLRTRMVEFEGISERLYAVVRQAAKETGKQVKLDIIGGTIEMDRGLLDRMTPSFEHLLRNAVAHGLEEPDARTRANKTAVGTITIGLHHEGNDVSVEFSDDGGGLNLDAIRKKAKAQGLVAMDVEIDEAEAANLIFTPGFSTATQITGLAGRGIGMDVVRSDVSAMGGRIETTTQAGKGTRFKMVLPLTTAVTQVVMLRAGDLSVGVPANVIEVVKRTPTDELVRAYKSGTLLHNGEEIPFFWAGALLQTSVRSVEMGGKTRPVLVFRSAAQRSAMHVDEVLGNQEVVVKNLGPQLSRLPGLSGMSVLASGAVVLIYNPVALATVYGDQVRASVDAAELQYRQDEAAQVARGIPQNAKAVVNQIPLVMVVDDSITVRRVTQRLLQREGYRVVMAADGLQALERLREERPTVVLSDIEMPRMDGFDLARNIRADKALQGLPIIMITSRIAEKHREHAFELGVNHYLGKPYSEEELLSLVRRYAAAQAAAQTEAAV